MSLNYRVEIRIPSIDRHGRRIESAKRRREVDATARFFVSHYGGAEIAEVRGLWNGEGDKVVVENVSIVSSYADEGKVCPWTMRMLAQRIAKQLDQETVALVLGDEMQFVSP